MNDIPHPHVVFKDESLYSFNSSDNERLYDDEIFIGEGTTPNTTYGIWVDGKPKLVVGTNSGFTSISEHTHILKDDFLLFAIGDHVCLYDLSISKLLWSLQVDDATCFGIYYSELNNAYISHGELSITRFDLNGSVVWQSTGADIFCEGFALHDTFVEATDFDYNDYRFDYNTGKSQKTDFV